MTTEHAAGPDQAGQSHIPAERAPHTPVAALRQDMGGRWEVRARSSRHIWDLDAMTYTRLPGLDSTPMPYDGVPVPFGRLKDDPGRLSGIEKGRHEAVRQMGGQVHDSIEDLKSYLGGLTSAQWSAVGLHPVRGEFDVESIVGRFVVSHLEEHADQLDLLAAS